VLTLWALCTLAAVPELKVATTTFTHVGLTDEKAAFFTEYLSARLAQADGVAVTSPKDIAAVLGMERQRQLMGCDDASNCIAELAGAMGVDAIVTGQIAKVGEKLQLTVKVVAAQTGRPLYVHSSDLLENDEAVVRELNHVASAALEPSRAALEKLRAAERAPAEAAVTEAAGGSSVKWGGLALLAAGVVLLGGSAASFVAARGDLETLKDTSRWDAWAGTDEPYRLRESGKLRAWVGCVTAAAGALAVLGGALWLALAPSTPRVSAWLAPGAGGVSVGGAF